MTRTLAAATLLFTAAALTAADAKLTVKVETKDPPKELAEPIRALLDTRAMHVYRGDKLVGTVWARKALDSKATAEEAKAGGKYAHLEETTLVGAVQFPEIWVDYRKQKIKAGVHTLRFAVQPMDGDHQGSAPYNDFLLITPADQDKSPDLLDVETLHKQSSKSVGRKHPGMMLLFPNRKPAEAPAIEEKPKDHVVLSFQVPVKAGAEKGTLGFSVVVVGVTAAE
jgi:hypothetical protein